MTARRFHGRAVFIAHQDAIMRDIAAGWERSQIWEDLAPAVRKILGYRQFCRYVGRVQQYGSVLPPKRSRKRDPAPAAQPTPPPPPTTQDSRHAGHPPGRFSHDARLREREAEDLLGSLAKPKR